MEEAFEANRKNWNKKVSIHAKSDFYELEKFKRGKCSLNNFEKNALGNVNGKTLLHLQCHFGQDTLSWNRLGAHCTGVDFSEEAISLAAQLNSELKLTSKFVCCNVYDVSKYISEQFDIVFTSYGTIGWLPDLRTWAKMIYERLLPGGIFYIVEFHPIAWMFDYQQKPPKLRYGYNQNEVIYEEYTGTYADVDAVIKSEEYTWNHGLSDVINSLLEAGLQLEYLKEHTSTPYNIFPNLIDNIEGNYEMENKLYPLLFEIKAKKIL